MLFSAVLIGIRDRIFVLVPLSSASAKSLARILNALKAITRQLL